MLMLTEANGCFTLRYGPFIICCLNRNVSDSKHLQGTLKTTVQYNISDSHLERDVRGKWPPCEFSLRFTAPKRRLIINTHTQHRAH